VAIEWRRLMARLGDKLGYEMYPRYMAQARPMALRMKDLFALCGIERVIDIGANRGQYRDFLRFDVGFTGTILSIEPDPELAGKARERGAALGDDRWTVKECALGRMAGRAVLNRMRQSAYNSFRAPRSTDPDADPNNAVVGRFEVEVLRLDDLLPTLGDMRRTFVKVDTQGFDLEVLAGGLEAFASVPLVKTEVSFHAIYAGTPGWLESIQAFEAQGFRFADLFVIPESCRQGLPVEGDCILMRPR
jgi:FkbM family methyltransferase